MAVIELHEALGNWHEAYDGIQKAAGPNKTWPGWQRDVELVQHYVPKITQAFQDGMAAARAFLNNLFSGQIRVTATWAAQEIRNIIAAAMRRALGPLWTEGYALGRASAVEATTGLLDWGGWEPGDVDAAALVADGPGLKRLLEQWGINVIQSISETRMDDLAQHIAQALVDGDSPDTLARNIESMLNVPRRARMIAQTELARAVTVATLDTYNEAGVERKQWLIAPDESVCPKCRAAEAEGAIPLTQAFEATGKDGPPAHPHCRCTTIPADTHGFDLSDMVSEPLPGFGAVPLVPALVKVGKEGYIHGWICVRPPCGAAPEHKIDFKDTSFGEDNTIIHTPSGYQIGRVGRGEDGALMAYHAGGDSERTINTMDGRTRVINMHNKLWNEPGKPAEEAPYDHTIGMDLRDVDPVLKAVITSHVKRFEQRYPEAAKTLTSISMPKPYQLGAYPMPDNTMATTIRGVDSHGNSTSSIQLNPKYWSDFHVIQRAMTDSTRTGFHRLDTMGSVMDHEFGHVIDNMYYDGSHSDTFPSHGPAWSSQIVNTHVSGYAAKNRREAFAEAFSIFEDNRSENQSSSTAINMLSTSQLANLQLLQDKKWYPPVYKQLAAPGNPHEPTCEGFVPPWAMPDDSAQKRARINICSQGHKHRGPGAAGILIRAPRPDGTMAYLLQQRDATADEPFTWSTFGGTLHVGESPRDGAMREVEEETGVNPGEYQLGQKVVDDHGKWAYTTYVADAPKAFWPSFDGSTPEETSNWGWFTPDEMRKLDLHPAFEAKLDDMLDDRKAEKVGPKGYIHGYVCVRPPCGDVPKVVKPEDLVAGTNGSIVHLPSGLELGTFQNAGADTFVVTHNNGVDSVAHGNDGVKATLAILHNMRDVEDDHVKYTEPEPKSPEDPDTARKRLDAVVHDLGTGHMPSFEARPFSVRADGWNDPKTAQSIEDYISPDGNDRINGNLKKIHPGDKIDPHTDDQISMLDFQAAHTKITKPAVLYRGFTAPQEMLDQLAPGQEFEDHAFVSTAFHPKFAAYFALLRAYGYVPGPEENNFPVVRSHGGKPTIMKINVPAGSGMFQGERDISEYVLPRNSKFRVTDVSHDGSLITVDALPPGDMT